MCSGLLEDLKTYDTILNATPSAAGPSRSVVSTATATGQANVGPLATLLDQAMEEMFVPWLEGGRYLESERKNLVELYGGLLSRFTRYHVSHSRKITIAARTDPRPRQETVLKAKPNSILDKVVNQLSTSSSAATSSSTAQAAAAAISKYANVFTSSASAYGNSAAKTASPSAASKAVLSPTLQTKNALPPYLAAGTPGAGTPGPRSGAMTPVGGRGTGMQRSDSVRGEMVNKGLEDKVWAVDGVLTLEMAERMLKWHAEAVGRVVELSSQTDV